MLHLKDGWPSKLRLGAICTLVFHHTVVLLFLTCRCEGQPHMVSPSQPIVATVGDDILLPCHLEPAVDASDQTVEWTRPVLNPRFIHVWRDGVELETKKHPSYAGRTSLSINKLKHGDVSLKLHKINLSDEGTYRCFIPTLNQESSVELVIGVVSSLVISLMSTENDEDISGVVLQCESAGWYPEPELFWLDGEGNLLSAGPTEIVRGPDGLYTVSSRVTVEQRHSSNFTCRVQQKSIKQSRETHIHVPDGFFSAPCSYTAYITITSAVVLVVFLAILFVAWKWRQKQQSHKFATSTTKTTATTLSDNTELHSLNKEERETLQATADSMEIKDLDEKANLDVQLKEEVEEHKYLIKMVNFLMNLKKDVENQIQDLKLQLHNEETHLSRNNSELERKQKDAEAISCVVSILTEKKMVLAGLIDQYGSPIGGDKGAEI